MSPMLSRVLVRNGKTLTLSVEGNTFRQAGDKPSSETFPSSRAAAEALVEVTRTRLGQGWVPSSAPKDVGTFTAALDDAHVSMWAWIVALTDDEVAWIYDRAIRNGGNVSLDVLKRRPARALFAWMLTHFDDYYEDDWTRAVKLLSKSPEQAAWIREELEKALEGNKLPTERAKKFAESKPANTIFHPRHSFIISTSTTSYWITPRS